jgi:cytochrome c oxidase assembly protein subunit 15
VASVRLPVVRPSFVRPILVANLVGEVVIVITGGIVRLTGSGLGCPTWPECVPGSFTPVPHQEEGIHKLIEFGNRTLTGVVGLLALACVWVVFTRMRRRRPLLVVAVGLVVGVLVQAVVGGIAVRMTLSPVVVAFHFLLSMVMIALSTMLLRGSEDGWSPDGTADLAPRELLVPRLVSTLAWVTTGVGAAVLVLGTIVTGSGPHSGDAEQPARTGFDPRSVAWLHADLVMLFAGLVVAVLVAVWLTSSSDRAKATWRGVLLVTLLQGAIGYVQYATNLPVALVAAHLLGATSLVVAVTAVVVALTGTPAASALAPASGTP